jgi:hypothetical protein
MSKYVVVLVPGQYEIYDTAHDALLHRICCCEEHEDAKRICDAMNKEHEVESKKEV